MNFSPASANPLDLLKTMLLIRRFEEVAGVAYGLRKIGGFCHLYIGEEAVAVGAIGALDLTTDYVLTAYRDHGHALACGMDPNVIMAELYGKATGCSRGKGGSMHMFDLDKHFLGGNGIVGAHIPVATGVALKIKYKLESGVVLCFFGDGAIHQGVFHESLNMARIWNLPIVYICENNHYGMGTEFHRVSIGDLSSMAHSYSMRGVQVDGMDVLAVNETVRAAVDEAKSGKPVLVEALTYRYKGHSMSDPGKYRSKEEVEEYKANDPIEKLKLKLITDNVISEDQYTAMDTDLKQLVEASKTFAEQSPQPEAHTLYEDVYA